MSIWTVGCYTLLNIKKTFSDIFNCPKSHVGIFQRSWNSAIIKPHECSWCEWWQQISKVYLWYFRRYQLSKIAQNLKLWIFGQKCKPPPAVKSSYLTNYSMVRYSTKISDFHISMDISNIQLKFKVNPRWRAGGPWWFGMERLSLVNMQRIYK